MRILKIILSCLFCMQGLYATAQNEERYVLASRGLRLRETPYLKGAVITTIPYGERIVFTDDKTLCPDTIDALHGYWRKTNYHGKEGYLFDGYTSVFPAPNIYKRWTTMKEYVFDHWKPVRQAGTTAGYNWFGGDTVRCTTWKVPGKIIFEDCTSYEEEYFEIVEFENADIQEVFLIGTQINYCFRGFSLDRDFEPREEDGIPCWYANVSREPLKTS